MLGRKTGACKKTPFQPSQELCVFQPLKRVGPSTEQKTSHLFTGWHPPKYPESSMKGAGALTCFLALILLMFIVHVINTHSPFQSTLILKMLYFTASRSKEAFDYCMHVYTAPRAAVQSILLTEQQCR